MRFEKAEHNAAVLAEGLETLASVVDGTWA
jgi:hypothetical protein